MSNLHYHDEFAKLKTLFELSEIIFSPANIFSLLESCKYPDTKRETI